MEIYNIKAKPKDIRLDSFDANLPFHERPDESKIIDILACLRPGRDFYIGSIRIQYITTINP